MKLKADSLGKKIDKIHKPLARPRKKKRRHELPVSGMK